MSKTLGQLAYETYMPLLWSQWIGWEGLPPGKQNAWEKTAQAVREATLATTPHKGHP